MSAPHGRSLQTPQDGRVVGERPVAAGSASPGKRPGKPRVLANLCHVVPGQVGGSEEYATRLLAAVSSPSAAAPVELELAAMAGVSDAHPELAGLTWHESRWTGSSRIRRLAVESMWLARRCADFDVVGLTVKTDPYTACHGAAALVIATEWEEFRGLNVGRVAELMSGAPRRGRPQPTGSRHLDGTRLQRHRER